MRLPLLLRTRKRLLRLMRLLRLLRLRLLLRCPHGLPRSQAVKSRKPKLG